MKLSTANVQPIVIILIIVLIIWFITRSKKEEEKTTPVRPHKRTITVKGHSRKNPKAKGKGKKGQNSKR